MYNHLLDTFLAVCDCKSFTKAAKQLYISPTAVMKQINQLEKGLDLKLIERTHAGVTPTSAGASIYQDSKFIIDYSKKHSPPQKAGHLPTIPRFASEPPC